MEPIVAPDLTDESPEYWEKVLASHGLSMKRGHRANKVAPVGNLKVLDFLSNSREQKAEELGGNCEGFDVRRVTPKGSSGE